MQAGDEIRCPGTEVAVRGERWRVLAFIPYDSCAALRLRGAERGNAHAQWTALVPFDRPQALRAPSRVRLVTRRKWWRAARGEVRRQRPFGALTACETARFRVLAYQLEPALACLRHGHLRLLIADAVGLGKTIQAGLLVAELAALDPDLRAIIICPAGLRAQWRSELREKFGVDASIADVGWLAHAIRELPVGINPLSLPGIYITSMDLAKRPEVVHALDALTWDLTIFDEAHALSPGTARLAAARTLADRSRRIVLLTATPPDSEPAHMAALRALGGSTGGPELTVFRRTRADVGYDEPRRVRLIPVRPSPAERRMHQQLAEYTELLWREAGRRHDSRNRLLAVLLRKRALSSARSLGLSLERRTVLLAGTIRSEVQMPLPLADEDPLDDLPSDGVLSADGLQDTGLERALLDRLRRSAEDAARGESKVAALTRFLTRIDEPAIIFTEYRDTLTHLAAALDGRTVLQLHGGMLPAEREAVQARFVGSGDILLATDAASEGLNLHHRCRLVVHFELPWNPSRLEQRVGRVDRLGQSRPVHELMLVARHTAERTVLEPLVRRLRAAQASTNAGRIRTLSESDVAAMILGDRTGIPNLIAQADETTPTAFRDEALEEAHRLQQLGGRGARLPERSPLLLMRRGANESDSWTLLVRATWETRGGRVLESVLVPLAVVLDAALVSAVQRQGVRTLRALVRGSEARIREILSAHPALQPACRTRWPLLLDALERREGEMIRTLQRGPAPFQVGLFDRRAEREAEGRHQQDTAFRADAASRLAGLRADRAVELRIRIVGAAPLDLSRR